MWKRRVNAHCWTISARSWKQLKCFISELLVTGETKNSRNCFKKAEQSRNEQNKLKWVVESGWKDDDEVEISTKKYIKKMKKKEVKELRLAESDWKEHNKFNYLKDSESI